jgi:hypothetical protein
MAESSLSLINVFEIQREGATQHLIGFIDPILAGARGIDARAILGEFTPGADGGFDPRTFQVNPRFITAFEEFMNEVAARSSELMDEATKHPGGRLNIVDGRFRSNAPGDPPSAELIGRFVIDEAGRIVPGSFRHNPDHVWFHPETGTSSILLNRQFYDWLHGHPA